MRALALAAGLSMAALVAGAGQGLAQVPGALGGGPIAPGSGFANGPPPAFSGGAVIAPGSGFLPSRAGTLAATPSIVVSPLPGQESDGLIARPPVPGGDGLHRPRRANPRAGYSTSYPGVPDIIAPAD